MVTDKAEEQTALHFACIILFLYLRIRACFLSRRSAASPSVPPVDAQQSLRPATVTEVTAKSLIFVLTQRHLNVFLLLNLQYWHANEPRENSLEEMCRLCYDQMAMGDIHCHSFAFLYPHHCGEFLTVSPGEKKKKKEREKENAQRFANWPHFKRVQIMRGKRIWSNKEEENWRTKGPSDCTGLTSQ